MIISGLFGLSPSPQYHVCIVLYCSHFWCTLYKLFLNVWYWNKAWTELNWTELNWTAAAVAQNDIDRSISVGCALRPTALSCVAVTRCYAHVHSCDVTRCYVALVAIRLGVPQRYVPEFSRACFNLTEKSY